MIGFAVTGEKSYAVTTFSTAEPEPSTPAGSLAPLELAGPATTPRRPAVATSRGGDVHESGSAQVAHKDARLQRILQRAAERAGMLGPEASVTAGDAITPQSAVCEPFQTVEGVCITADEVRRVNAKCNFTGPDVAVVCPAGEDEHVGSPSWPSSKSTQL
jgi:hypothetical protein